MSWTKKNTQFFDWYKLLQCEKQTVAIFVRPRSRLMVATETSAKRKVCLPWRSKHHPRMWLNNWNWPMKWLMLWIVQTEGNVWLCCNTMCTSPKVPTLKSSYIQKKEEWKKSQQFFYVKYKLQNFENLPDVLNSIWDVFSANQPICNVLLWVIAIFYSFSFSIYLCQDE